MACSCARSAAFSSCSARASDSGCCDAPSLCASPPPDERRVPCTAADDTSSSGLRSPTWADALILAATRGASCGAVLRGSGAVVPELFVITCVCPCVVLLRHACTRARPNRRPTLQVCTCSIVFMADRCAAAALRAQLRVAERFVAVRRPSAADSQPESQVSTVHCAPCIPRPGRIPDTSNALLQCNPTLSIPLVPSPTSAPGQKVCVGVCESAYYYPCPTTRFPQRLSPRRPATSRTRRISISAGHDSEARPHSAVPLSFTARSPRRQPLDPSRVTGPPPPPKTAPRSQSPSAADAALHLLRSEAATLTPRPPTQASLRSAQVPLGRADDHDVVHSARRRASKRAARVHIQGPSLDHHRQKTAHLVQLARRAAGRVVRGRKQVQAAFRLALLPCLTSSPTSRSPHPPQPQSRPPRWRHSKPGPMSTIQNMCRSCIMRAKLSRVPP